MYRTPWAKSLYLFACLALLCLVARAQETQPPVKDPLAEGQKEVAGRYSRLEDLLLRSAELEAGENPTRAALLQQAVQLSKQAQLSDLLAKAASNLEQKQFSEAIEQQRVSRENLKRILELLQSENREERVREKRDQVRRWIEETDRLLRLQSSLRGRTEGGQDASQAALDQNKLADKADDISNDLKSDDSDAESGEPSSSNDPTRSSEEDTAEGQPDRDAEGSPDSTPGAENATPDQPPSNGQSSESGGKQEEDASEGGNKEASSDSKDPSDSADDPSGQSGEEGSKTSEASESSEKSGDGEQSEQSEGASQSQQGQPSEGQPSSQQPAQGQPSEGQPSSEQQPGQGGQGQPSPPQESQDPTERARQRIEQAQQRMKEAQQQLEQAEREGAVEKQLEAENSLRQAIEELEEILRQLREEEIERSLASLETRLRRMLEMQTQVFEETERLQQISGDQAARQIEIRANSLARDERKILAEGERAYLLLREEGSSVAFPEAIEQVNTDISKVAERLSEADVGRLTVVIEQAIVSSLEEMVEALVQVQKDNKEKQQQQQQGQQQQGQRGDQPLVDKLAEIRLIRTLQVRINNRTTALSEMLSDPADPVGQVEQGEVLDELRGLSTRQGSLQQVTRDIVVGKGE